MMQILSFHVLFLPFVFPHITKIRPDSQISTSSSHRCHVSIIIKWTLPPYYCLTLSLFLHCSFRSHSPCLCYSHTTEIASWQNLLDCIFCAAWYGSVLLDIVQLIPIVFQMVWIWPIYLANIIPCCSSLPPVDPVIHTKLSRDFLNKLCFLTCL